MEGKEITLGQLLDLIDKSRSSDDECIKIVKEGKCLCTGLVCWDGWKYLEDRVVEFLEAEDTDVYTVWLKDSEDKDG